MLNRRNASTTTPPLSARIGSSSSSSARGSTNCATNCAKPAPPSMSIDALRTELHRAHAEAIALQQQSRGVTPLSATTSRGQAVIETHPMAMTAATSNSSDDNGDCVLDELQMGQRTSFLVAATDTHEALAHGATSFSDRDACDAHGSSSDTDDNDTAHIDAHGCYLVDSPEIAAFLGLTAGANAAYTQQQVPPHAPFLKAASFSGPQQYYQQQYYQQQQQQQLQRSASRGSPVPCSPPVPIPRQQLRRRRNTVTGSLLSTSRRNSSRVPAVATAAGADDHYEYSRSQSEASLWDDDWHFKLSLEARESFEAANSKDVSATITTATTTGARGAGSSGHANRRRTQSCNSSTCAAAAVWKAQSTASMASTADTARDEDSTASDCCCDDDDDDSTDDAHHVFDMDDL